MKWVSFLVMGIVCSIVYGIPLGLVVIGIEKSIGSSPILEALKDACAITFGFVTSYELWPPRKKAEEPEKKS